MSTPMDHTRVSDRPVPPSLPPPLPDFSEYLVGDRIAQEESGWARVRYYERNAAQVMAAARMFGLGERFHLLELGCGSGWVPTALPDTIVYGGIDNNAQLLVLAAAKNGHHRMFYRSDLRVWPTAPAIDLVASFAVLKHFGLHEWADVFTRMLSHGRHGVFNIQLCPPSRPAYDDGTEFHHTWIDEHMVERCVRGAGKRIYRSEVLHSDPARGDDAIFYVGPDAFDAAADAGDPT
jgi:hypothetical protein